MEQTITACKKCNEPFTLLHIRKKIAINDSVYGDVLFHFYQCNRCLHKTIIDVTCNEIFNLQIAQNENRYNASSVALYSQKYADLLVSYKIASQRIRKITQELRGKYELN